MSENPPWLTFFNVNPSELKMGLNKKSESLTYWCLKNGKIAIKPYLKWAREYYKLASIEDSFFKNENSALLSLFMKYKKFPWSKNYLPVSEWEGILFVACIEPPKENWSIPARFLLASNENLEKLWNTFKKHFPELNNLKKTETPLQNLRENINESSPSGLKGESLENLSPEWAHSNKESTQFNKKEGFENQKIELQPNKENLSKSNESSAENPFPNEEVAFFSNPSKNSKTLESENTEEEKPSKKNEHPTQSIVKESEGSEAISLEPFSLSSFNDEIHDIKTLVQWTFEQMNPFFSHCLWLFLKENHFFCWRYTDNLKPQNANQLIDYTQPSIFRIVFRTGLPYHGYTTSSSVNDQFFENWGFEAHPEHITAFPIKNNESCIGILMGIGDVNSNTEKALSQTEKIVDRITQTLKTLNLSVK